MTETLIPSVSESTTQLEGMVENVLPENTPLTLRDRCDGVFKARFDAKREGCEAAAAVRVLLPTSRGQIGTLLFCGHCFTINEQGLRSKAYRVDDQRVEPENRLIGSHN